VVILLAVAAVAPLNGADVTSSVTFSIAFFATLLTGEAVIFVFSFAPSSAWPSLRDIDSHIAFREWVVVGWLAAMLTASGLPTHAAIAATYGALLFLLADAFGMFSFVRLFGLASAEGRKRLMRRTLAGALTAVTPSPAGALSHRMRSDPILNAYLGQLDDAAARSDGNGVRDLADELASAGRTADGTANGALHLDVVHRLAKAALVGGLDPVVASAAAGGLIDSLLAGITSADHGRNAGTAPPAAAVMAQASRYLAWLANTSLTMSAREVTTAVAARELVAFSGPGPVADPAARRSRSSLRGGNGRPRHSAIRRDVRAGLGQRLHRIPWRAPGREHVRRLSDLDRGQVPRELLGRRFDPDRAAGRPVHPGHERRACGPRLEGFVQKYGRF